MHHFKVRLQCNVWPSFAYLRICVLGRRNHSLNCWGRSWLSTFGQASLNLSKFINVGPLAINSTIVGKYFLPICVMPPFYTACCFDELIDSLFCVFFELASGERFPPPQPSFLCTVIDDSGSRRKNTMRIVTQWWHPGASNVPQNVLNWAMCMVLHQQNAMTIKMTSKREVIVLFSLICCCS